MTQPLNVTTIGDPSELPDHLPVWRYMKLSAFLLLMEGTAFFPSVAALQRGDGLEGMLHPDPAWLMNVFGKLSRTDLGEIESWLLEQATESERGFQKRNKDDPWTNTRILADLYVRELAKRRAVWCWIASEIESAGMWSIYGSGGIAVGTTLRRLKEALPTSREFQIAKIVYADRRPCSHHSFDPENRKHAPLVHRPHLVKVREYAHEDEVRLVTLCDGWKAGTLIRGIDPDTLIEEIRLSPLLPLEEAKALERFIKSRRWKDQPDIRRSSLLGDSDQLEDSSFVQAFKEYLGDGPKETGLPPLIRNL